MGDRRWEEISAALDGERPMPGELSAADQEFVEHALALRGALRVTRADPPPDVSGAVLDRLRAAAADATPAPKPPSGGTAGRLNGRTRYQTGSRRVLLAAAAAFVLAAVAGALAVRPGGPVAPSPAAAGIAERVIAGQHAVDELHARVTVLERGVHPDVPGRRLAGTLRYQGPESLWLHLEEQGPRTPGWPPNDIDLVLGPGVAWSVGLGGCPVGAQPACLERSSRVVRDLPPFAPAWRSSLDLVMPTGAFLPVVATSATEEDGTVAIDTTVARIERLVDGLTAAGAIRAVHSTDRVRLVLDRDTLTLRDLTVEAADNLARSTWAATNGYGDRPGDVVLRVTLDPSDTRIDPAPPSPTISEGTDAVAAGFVERELPAAWPAPAGFELHRTGVLEDGGPSTRVHAYRDGRAWIRIDVTDEWDEPRLFGALGPLVRPVPVADGVGYTDPAGTRLALHGHARDVLVAGSVDLETLIDAAGGIVASGVVDGGRIDAGWTQAAHAAEIPAGALVPAGAYTAAIDGTELTIGVGGPGSTGVVIAQAPAVALPPPVKGDVVEVVVRGRPARYAPRLGMLTWLEDGWRREIRGAGLDLDQLRSVAESLVEP